MGWTKYLSISVLWWLTLVSFTNLLAPIVRSVILLLMRQTVLVSLMTAVYREQWIFWAATNIFSIYLWWGESLQIQGKYFIYLINSLVGWYQWSKAAKKA
ncbi:MAG: nicotinamide riboside transporter PnuC [Streptococcus salivarius]